MNRTKTIIQLILIILTLGSCNKSNEDKLNVILNSDYLEIQVNGCGGIAGYFEQKFYLKKNEFESLIIVDKGTDYQTFVRIEDDRKLFKEFINEAYRTNDPEKEYNSSCIGGIDYVYIFKSGFTTLELKPSRECDSLFEQIMYKKQ